MVILSLHNQQLPLETTVGWICKHEWKSTTDTRSHAAAFVPFLSLFFTGGCWWRGGRINCWFYSSLQWNSISNKITGNRTGTTPTATFPKNETISSHWEIWQGRWGAKCIASSDLVWELPSCSKHSSWKLIWKEFSCNNNSCFYEIVLQFWFLRWSSK